MVHDASKVCQRIDKVFLKVLLSRRFKILVACIYPLFSPPDKLILDGHFLLFFLRFEKVNRYVSIKNPFIFRFFHLLFLIIIGIINYGKLFLVHLLSIYPCFPASLDNAQTLINAIDKLRQPKKRKKYLFKE